METDAGLSAIARWAPPTRPYPAARRVGLLALPAGVPVAAAILGGTFGGAAVAGVAALVVGAAAVLAATRSVLGPAAGPAPARAQNIVKGLAPALGIEVPAVELQEDAVVNAWAERRFGRRGRVMVTHGFTGLTRTEQEAVLAHCLVRLAAPEAPYAALAAALGRAAHGLAPVAGAHHDAGAAALTRYPPALTAALRSCDPDAGRGAPLAFLGTGPSHQGRAERLAALADL